MEKNFLNENVEILVSFAGALRESGYSPVAYIGKLTNIDDNYIMIDVIKSEVKTSGVLGSIRDHTVGMTAFRKEYIIYIRKI